MSVQNPGHGPPASDLLHPTVVALEDGWRPDSVHLESVADVVVGCGKAGCQVPLVEAACVRIRAGVQGVAKAILRVQGERLAEGVLQSE